MAARALLQAAGRTRLSGQEGVRVALTSVPEFAEDFIHSLSHGVAGAWRERWWSADLLLIDGAQALSATERAQEEFFHLFEALQRRRARVMISADRPPAKIPALDDRLRARLEGGLVVEIEVEGTSLSPDLRESLEETSPQELPPETEIKAIVNEDREWIKSFQPGTPVGPAGALGGIQEGEDGGFLDVLAAGREVSTPVEAWVPSPEKVIWVWPMLEERIVEEPD